MDAYQRSGKEATPVRIAKEIKPSAYSQWLHESGERGDGDGEARGDMLSLTPRGISDLENGLRAVEP